MIVTIIINLLQVYLVSKFCLSLFWTLLVLESLLGISEISSFNVGSFNKNCPSAKCAIPTDVYRDTKVPATKTVFLNHIL
jgi:hypothetical protein